MLEQSANPDYNKASVFPFIEFLCFPLFRQGVLFAEIIKSNCTKYLTGRCTGYILLLG